jgi:thioredoxin-dependent peroxiredoxin
MVVRPVYLADLAGMVRLLNIVNSLERPLCQLVTLRWEAHSASLPSDSCIYTVSMDSPEMLARWQDSASVLHQRFLPITASGSARTMACGSRSGVCCRWQS